MATALEARLIRMEIVARRLADENARMRAELDAVKRGLGMRQTGPYAGGGGGGDARPMEWIWLTENRAGAFGTDAPRLPSVFTTSVYAVSQPYDDSNINSSWVQQTGKTVRWWGLSQLYAGEILRVFKAPDGAYDAFHRCSYGYGEVYNPNDYPGDYDANAFFRIGNAKSIQTAEYDTSIYPAALDLWPFHDSRFAPVPQRASRTLGEGGNVWAFNSSLDLPKHGERVMLHLAPDVVMFFATRGKVGDTPGPMDTEGPGGGTDPEDPGGGLDPQPPGGGGLGD